MIPGKKSKITVKKANGNTVFLRISAYAGKKLTRRAIGNLPILRTAKDNGMECSLKSEKLPLT